MFVANTCSVYAVPFDSPLTTMGEDAPVFVAPPGVAIAVYPVIAPPPIFEGAVKTADAVVSPAVAVPIVGASGTFNPL
jgi:hypothetical protein